MCCYRWCTWFCKPPKDAYSIGELSAMEVGDVLQAGQIELYFLLAIQLVIHVLWQLLAFIPGVCPIEGASSFNAVCHTGFWVIVDLLAFAVGVASVGFSVWVDVNGDLFKDVTRTRNWLLAWIVLTVIAAGANVVHAIAAIFEHQNCTTTLCVDNATNGYLISIPIVLAVLVLVEALQIYRASTYRIHLELVNTYHTGTFTMLKSASLKAAPVNDSVAVAVSSMRATPMRHGLKQRAE